MNTENKRRISYWSGIIGVLIGSYIIIFIGTNMWVYTLGLCLGLIGGWLINKSRHLIDIQPAVKIHSEGKGTIPECRKALIKSWVGVAMVFAALVLITKLAKSEWWELAILFGLICGFAGLILSVSYLRCVKRINERQ